MICPNGHESPGSHPFCRVCGVPLLLDQKLCANGHLNAEKAQYCVDCGSPVAPPQGPGIGGSSGRWRLDPTRRHHFRYFNGVEWTKHVADVGAGKLGIDPKPRRRSASRTDILVGLVLLILIVGVISATSLMFSRSTPAASGASGAQGPGVAPSTAAPPAQYLPTPTTYRPFAVIGAPCPPDSINGVQKHGTVAYCEFLPDSQSYMWSMYPGAIESPYDPAVPASEREEPSIAVCMMQRGLTREACVAELPGQ